MHKVTFNELLFMNEITRAKKQFFYDKHSLTNCFLFNTFIKKYYVKQLLKAIYDNKYFICDESYNFLCIK